MNEPLRGSLWPCRRLVIEPRFIQSGVCMVASVTRKLCSALVLVDVGITCDIATDCDSEREDNALVVSGR